MNYPAPLKDGNAQSVIDIITQEMPGFEAVLVAKKDFIRWRGPIYLMGTVTMDYVLQVAAGHEEQLARELVDRTRADAITRLGLQKRIDYLIEQAERRARTEGHASGVTEGIARGRREMLAEILAAKEDVDDPRD